MRHPVNFFWRSIPQLAKNIQDKTHRLITISALLCSAPLFPPFDCSTLSASTLSAPCLQSPVTSQRFCIAAAACSRLAAIQTLGTQRLGTQLFKSYCEGWKKAKTKKMVKELQIKPSSKSRLCFNCADEFNIANFTPRHVYVFGTFKIV